MREREHERKRGREREHDKDVCVTNAIVTVHAAGLLERWFRHCMIQSPLSLILLNKLTEMLNILWLHYTQRPC